MFNPISLHRKYKNRRWYQTTAIGIVASVILFIAGIAWNIFNPVQQTIVQEQNVIGNQTIYQQILVIDKKEPISKLEVSIMRVFWGPTVYNSPENMLITKQKPFNILWGDRCYKLAIKSLSKLGNRTLNYDPYVVFLFDKNESYYTRNCDWYNFDIKNVGLLHLTNTTITYKKGTSERKLIEEKKPYINLSPNETVTFFVNSCTPLFDVYVWNAEEGLVDNVALIETAMFPCDATTGQIQNN